MTEKACRRCSRLLPVSAFSSDKTHRDGFASACRECRSVGNQAWRARHRAENLEKKKRYYKENRVEISMRRNQVRNGAKHLAKLKQEVFNHYGNRCYCCGLADPRFLTIEHLNNDGSTVRHRNGNGKRVSGSTQYRYIIESGFPDDITLACFNCNCARAYWGRGGKCPHLTPLPADCDVSTLIVEHTTRRIQSGDFDLPAYLGADIRTDEKTCLPTIVKTRCFKSKQDRDASGE